MERSVAGALTVAAAAAHPDGAASPEAFVIGGDAEHFSVAQLSSARKARPPGSGRAVPRLKYAGIFALRSASSTVG